MGHEADSWETTVTAPDQAYYQQVYQYEGENKSQDAMTAFLRSAQDVSPQQLNQVGCSSDNHIRYSVLCCADDYNIHI
jgi:hypothetical protein